MPLSPRLPLSLRVPLPLTCLLLLFVHTLTLTISLPILHVAAGTLPQAPDTVRVSGRQLLVDGAIFPVRGIAYSPVPAGENVNFPPYGDYFTIDYAYIWSRDLQQMRDMGINTVRIYAWKITLNHAPFLDVCAKLGLKVIITHYLGTSKDTPVETEVERQDAIDKFANHVKMYGDHPAILAWVAGNELNGAWLGFKAAFSTSGGCNWEPSCEQDTDTRSACFAATDCVYAGLFGWLNDMAAAGKVWTSRPITTAWADVDHLTDTTPSTDRLPRFDHLLTAMDFYTVQLYRGRSFGAYFAEYQAETAKPLLVGEYGVDAYNDPCGWPENFWTQQPCYAGNVDGQPNSLGGSKAVAGFRGCEGNAGWDCTRPGEQAQADWDHDLTDELFHSSTVIGGVLFSWHDEFWKGIGTEDQCETPCPSANLTVCQDPNSPEYAKYQMDTGSAKCTYKAHITCANWDTSVHDLCGYFLGSAPDRYVNEEWFGVNGVKDCGVTADQYGGHRLSSLQPRPVIGTVGSVFQAANPPTTAATCDQLLPCWYCVRDAGVEAVQNGACNVPCAIQLDGISDPPALQPRTVILPPFIAPNYTVIESSSTGVASSSTAMGSSSSSTGTSTPPPISSSSSSTGPSSWEESPEGPIDGVTITAGNAGREVRPVNVVYAVQLLALIIWSCLA